MPAFAKDNQPAPQIFWEVTAGLIPPASGQLWWRVERAEQWAVVDGVGVHGPNTQVTVWQTPEGVTLVSAFFTSDSGDWAYFVDYCYRLDGKLARSTSTLNSFVAANPPDGIRRVRTRYYTSTGLLLASRTSVRNLATGESLRIRVGGYQEPAYVSVEKLPFFSLLAAATAPR